MGRFGKIPVSPAIRRAREPNAGFLISITNNRRPSPQPSNLRVGPQLPLNIVTAAPEDDVSGAARRELGETFAQLLASACEGHLVGGGPLDERVMAVRNVEV